MPRKAKAWYYRGAYRTHWGGQKNYILLRGKETRENERQANKILEELRRVNSVPLTTPHSFTPAIVVADKYLVSLEHSKPLHHHASSYLGHFFGVKERQFKKRKPFHIDTITLPISAINADLVNQYLDYLAANGLATRNPFAAIRSFVGWALANQYIQGHDLDNVKIRFRRIKLRPYIPPESLIQKALQNATGPIKRFLQAMIFTGMRPKEILSLKVEDYQAAENQIVLHNHKTYHRTGRPRIIPIEQPALQALLVELTTDKPSDSPIFQNKKGAAYHYYQLGRDWRKLKAELDLPEEFELYCLRHWYLTVAIEAGESGNVVSELAGHTNPATMQFYQKIRNAPLHDAARRVSESISTMLRDSTPTGEDHESKKR